MTHLILFDIDGTLLMGKGIGREATRRAMLDVFGSEGTLTTHQFGGKTDWLTLTEVLANEGHTADTIGAHMPRYERIMSRHMAELIAAYEVLALPGAMDVVTHLRQRDDVLLGIVTGNVAMTAPVKLRAAGFDPDWFPVGAFGSERVDRNDLPPLAMERASQRIKSAITAQQVTIIGDTLADIDCARAVGARAIAVATGFTARAELIAAAPDHLLDDLTGLLPVLAL
jgi:phosphoglycolate phosphatase-like HAD superfamily hydrolase